jgi:outer membrane protein TolC
MHRASSPHPPRLRTLRRLARALCPACLVLLVGCAQTAAGTYPNEPPVVRAQSAPELPPPGSGTPAVLPPPSWGDPPKVLPPASPAPAPHPLPLTLDTVLRLAQDQNGQVAIARARLEEAFAQRDVAAKAWLPDLWVGTSYYRHEGGIQNEDGTFTHSSFGSLFAGTEIRGRFDLREAVFQKVDAERKVWQQKGELSRLTSENLLEAANTYVDLLTARSGEALALGVRKILQDLLERTEKLAKADPAFEVEVPRIRGELNGQDFTIRKLREGARAAAVKLLYLLGLDPSAELVLLDRQLVAFQLVDPYASLEQLVQEAVTKGPGVRELEGLLNLIHEAACKAQGPGKYLPTFDIRMGEGVFGAGAGSRSTWDNRFDVVLQARWNLTPLFSAQERKRVAQAKMQQVHLSMDDLRRKLTMGVQEAYEATRGAQERMRHAERQVAQEKDAHDRSEFRLRNVKGTAPSEVLLGIRALGGARYRYLQAVQDQDKAQLRLMVLLGLGAERCHP